MKPKLSRLEILIVNKEKLPLANYILTQISKGYCDLFGKETFYYDVSDIPQDKTYNNLLEEGIVVSAIEDYYYSDCIVNSLAIIKENKLLGMAYAKDIPLINGEYSHKFVMLQNRKANEFLRNYLIKENSIKIFNSSSNLTKNITSLINLDLKEVQFFESYINSPKECAFGLKLEKYLPKNLEI